MKSGIGRTGTAGLRAPVVAALLMLGMALCYAVTANVARLMTEELNAMMIALLRNAFGLVVLLPTLARTGPAILRTTRPGLHVLRSFLNLTSMLAWFWALPTSCWPTASRSTSPARCSPPWARSCSWASASACAVPRHWRSALQARW